MLSIDFEQWINSVPSDKAPVLLFVVLKCYAFKRRKGVFQNSKEKCLKTTRARRSLAASVLMHKALKSYYLRGTKYRK